MHFGIFVYIAPIARIGKGHVVVDVISMLSGCFLIWNVNLKLIRESNYPAHPPPPRCRTGQRWRRGSPSSRRRSNFARLFPSSHVCCFRCHQLASLCSLSSSSEMPPVFSPSVVRTAQVRQIIGQLDFTDQIIVELIIWGACRCRRSSRPGRCHCRFFFDGAAVHADWRISWVQNKLNNNLVTSNVGVGGVYFISGISGWRSWTWWRKWHNLNATPHQSHRTSSVSYTPLH